MKDESFDKTLKGAFGRIKAGSDGTGSQDIPDISEAQKARIRAGIRNLNCEKGEVRMKHKNHGWRRAAVIALCAVLLGMGMVGVYAGVPAVRDYINMLFWKESAPGRLTEVPEGWIAVRTVEDLETIREGLDGKYILMNDIRIPDEAYAEGGIYENGFAPIGPGVAEEGVRPEYFTGSFDGNGYVISNLQIKAGPGDKYVGLFGLAEAIYDLDRTEGEEEYGYETQLSGGFIKNLGITDSSVTVDIRTAPENTGLYVGVIAGKCEFVAGCYADRVEVTVLGAPAFGEQPESYENGVNPGRIVISGLVGEATIVDSCYSKAAIRVDMPEPPVNTLYVAGVTAFAKACATSYFDGTIDSTASDLGAAYSYPTDLPIYLNRDALRGILFAILNRNYGQLTEEDFADTEWRRMDERAAEYEGIPEENLKEAQKFNAFYATTCRIEYLQDFMTYDVSAEEDYPYLLDPNTYPRERLWLSKFIANTFEGDDFIEFCQQHGIKYGGYFNYDLRADEACAFDGFDFERIWSRTEDGAPVLTIFTAP